MDDGEPDTHQSGPSMNTRELVAGADEEVDADTVESDADCILVNRESSHTRMFPTRRDTLMRDVIT